MTPLDAEIANHRAALLRYQERIDAMGASARGSCCAVCYHGAAFVHACEKLDRCRDWFARLLRKRNAEGDAGLATAAERGAWP